MIVLAVGIFLTVTKGVLDDAGAIAAQNAQYQKSIAKWDELRKQRAAISAQYDAVSDADKQVLNKMLPDSVDNIRLIIDMNNIANEHKLVLKGVKASSPSSDTTTAPDSSATRRLTPGPAGASAPGGLNTLDATKSGGPTLQTVAITFSVSATYAQFLDLMTALEKNLRLMDLTHLTLSANNTGTYDYSVELQTYWLKAQ